MSARIDYRHVLARLATGPLYEGDTDHWLMLKSELERVRAHYAAMGLEVVMDDVGGYAFLRQRPDDEESAWNQEGMAPIPRILRRTALSYQQTLLLVLLRERLLRHEQSPDLDTPLYLDLSEITEMLRPYYPESNNEKKLYDSVQTLIRRFDALNLLFPMKNRSDSIYRVEQIIKAKLPAEMIAEVRDRLAELTKPEPETVP
ncbi:MAG: DUF4194 domain-containing protein [Verrucomicrobiota bacterium]|nr:DUF4194 domain-containing protein [Verrucomicrobiota bacterium]